jgi:DUF971 family protein
VVALRVVLVVQNGERNVGAEAVEDVMKVGDYALVVAVPEEWEGSGETDQDRLAYVGHVGRVEDITDDYALVIFPWDEGFTLQRNIELTALRCVGMPTLRLSFTDGVVG